MPSGGEERRFLYSWKRRFEATVEAMVGGGRGGRMGGVWAGFSAVEDEFWNWGADTSDIDSPYVSDQSCFPSLRDGFLHILRLL